MIAVINSSLLKKLPFKPQRYEVRDEKLKGLTLTIFPSGRMTYRCNYGRGKFISIGNAVVITPAQARQKAKDILGQVARGIDPTAKYNLQDGITLEKFIRQEYTPWFKAEKPDTWQKELFPLKEFCRLFGNKNLTQITPYLIDKWKAKRMEGEKAISSASINRYLTTLQAALSRAVSWKIIKENPLARLKKAKVENDHRIRYLTQKEYQNLLFALDAREETIRCKRAEANRWRKARSYPLLPDLRQQKFVDSLKPKVLLSLASGMRLCELRRIRREVNVDLTKSGLKLTKEVTKTKKPRFIPLDADTLKILKDWLKQTEKKYGNTGPVFPAKDGKSQFDNMNKAWKKLLQDAKIDNFRWHDLRHDYASQLVMSGVDLNTVRELLGHTDFKTTLKYAHLAPEYKADAVKQLVNRRKKLLKD
ncbi:MAG: site-specific integrase [Pseudomonadota bacterium]